MDLRIALMQLLVFFVYPLSQLNNFSLPLGKLFFQLDNVLLVFQLDSVLLISQLDGMQLDNPELFLQLNNRRLFFQNHAVQVDRKLIR